jgi:hypothetical protein
MNPSLAEYVVALVQACPKLEDLLREHVSTYGEILAHPFMGEARAWAEAAIERGDVGPDSTLACLLNEVERALTIENEAVQELVAVSFFEYFQVPRAGDPATHLFGRRSRGVLDAMGLPADH